MRKAGHSLWPAETVAKAERREGKECSRKINLPVGNHQGSPSASSEADQPARRRSKVGESFDSPTFVQLGVNGRREPDFFDKLRPGVCRAFYY